jgi:hypothetical protein
MASMAGMIDLSKFPKLGVRVPLALKRKARRLAFEMEAAGFVFQHGEMTMEAVFSVSVLAVLAMDDAAQREVFGRCVPELLAMFEAETPEGGGGCEKKPAERGAGEGNHRVESRQEPGPKSAVPRKKRG